MANDIRDNANNFILWEPSSAQPETTPCYTGCDEIVRPCLPIFSLTDLAFQLVIDDTDATFSENLGVAVYLGGDCPTGSISDHTDDILQSWDLPFYALDTDEYLLQFDFDDVSITEDLCESGDINDGECVRIVLYDTSSEAIRFCSNCFTYQEDICYTKVIRYTNLEDAFGLYYDSTYGFGTVYNRVRLYLTCHSPTWPKEKTVFKKSDGSYQKLASRVDKQYQVLVDYQVEDFMQALTIALEHDQFWLYDDQDDAWEERMAMEDDEFEPQWDERPGQFKRHAQTTFVLRVTPFDNLNSNC